MAIEKCLKSEFPIFSEHEGLVYLDTAATSQKPFCVIDRLVRFYSREYGTVHRALYGLSRHATDLYEGVRKKIASFLDASTPEEVIFTRGSTESLNFLAEALTQKLVAGDEIILSQMEHHANLVPWQMAAEKKGLSLSFIPLKPDDTLDLEWLQKKISPKTKIVSVTHVSNVLGTINPIEKIRAIVGTDICLIVDGAQGACYLPLSLKTLGADFYLFSGHKVYGPTGVGVLWGKKKILETLPPFQGGGDMIEEVLFEKSTYQPPPHRFEAGTPLIAEVVALGEAISFIEEIGASMVQKHEKMLYALALEELESVPGFSLIGKAPEKRGILSFVIEGIHPMDLALYLDLKKIAIRSGHMCAQPLLRTKGFSHLSRASFGVYSTEEDVVYFTRALKNAIDELR